MSTARPLGRPVGSDGSRRAAILAAARELFAQAGYDGTSLRRIATEAGVDVALISHYFGNKEGLFLESLRFPAAAASRISEALARRGPNRARELTRTYLQLWEDPSTGSQFRIVARAVVGGGIMGDRIEGMLAELLGVYAGAPAAERERLGLALAQLLGIAVSRHITQIPTLARVPFEQLVDTVAPAVQATLDGPAIDPAE